MNTLTETPPQPGGKSQILLPLVGKVIRSGSVNGGMLTRLASFTVHRPKLVLAVVTVLLGISIVFGGGVSDKLGVGGYNAPSSESVQADAFLDDNFGTTSNLIVQVIADQGTVESPEVKAAADKVQHVIEAEPTAKVTRSFTDAANTDLRSNDKRSGLILVHVSGTADEAADTAKQLISNLPEEPNVTIRAGGTLGVQKEIRTKVKHDLLISESIALPVSLAVLVVVFGGLVAAFLPIVVGLSSIVTTLLVLVLMTKFTDVSTHALTVATAFGLGLSIDFGLLMVSRFREERAHGRDHEDAIIATVATAGRTIIFSAATVTLAMTSLLVFPTYFLRSVGITASACVILSALSAIIVLPAVLALLGKRIDSLALIRRKTAPSADSMFWRNFAEKVIRRPLMFALPVVIVLLALGIPFMKVQFGNPDERALPTDSNARLVAESLQSDYPLDPSQAITLVTRTHDGELKDLAIKVSGMDGVKLVNGPVGKFEHGKAVGQVPPPSASGSSYAFVFLAINSDSSEAEQLVRDIRAQISDKEVEVGGPTATLIDSRAAIAERLPYAIGLIVLSTFVLLFLFTGSIVVPAKALLLNVLVLSGVLGVMVWVFQEGHLASFLGITPAPLNLSMVVLLCSIAFSLSVDYEIFLLSRIKEARDEGMPNNEAIVIGLGRVGRIVTSAALLLTITLVSFANGMSFMKMFGLGTALAVVIDATIIRAVVVPAFLRLAGDWNWWAPKPLRWLHSRIGISEAMSFAVNEATTVMPRPDLARLAANHAPVPTPVSVDVADAAAARVEVVPGHHLVASVHGTVIVVANRGSVAKQAVAAKQMRQLVEIVKRSNTAQLVYAFTQLMNSGSWSSDLAEVGIVVPTPSGLEIFVCGGVTVALDDGHSATMVQGRGRCSHLSVQAPSVAAVITVDEAGMPPALAPLDRNAVFSLPSGIVPGRGAVVWSADAAAVPQPEVRMPAYANRPALAPVGPRPRPWILLDDNSRIEIDRDSVIGRDPSDSNAVQRGLRPIRVDDHTDQMSRAHLEVRLVNGEMVIVDLNSSNGVLMCEPGQRGWTRIAPGQPVTFRAGTSIQLGGRTFQAQSLVVHQPPARQQAYLPQGQMQLAMSR